MNYVKRPTISEVLKDPSTSDFLRFAIQKSLNRDPLDALYDAQMLYDLMSERVEAL